MNFRVEAGVLNTRTPENNSGSSRSSSISSEQENIRPPLQRMPPISPPTSPQGRFYKLRFV